MRKTGNYLNNVTGEQIYVIDAMKKGFLKGSPAEDTKGLNIDPRNKIVVEAILKKYVLNPVSVIVAFRRAAKHVSSC